MNFGATGINPGSVNNEIRRVSTCSKAAPCGGWWVL